MKPQVISEFVKNCAQVVRRPCPWCGRTVFMRRGAGPSICPEYDCGAYHSWDGEMVRHCCWNAETVAFRLVSNLMQKITIGSNAARKKA